MREGRRGRRREQEEPARGETEERQELAIAWTVDGRGAENRPRQRRRRPHDGFGRELAPAVGVDRMRIGVLAGGPRGRAAADGGEARDEHDAGARRVGRLDHGSGAVDVHGRELGFGARARHRGRVNDDLRAGNGRRQRRGVEGGRKRFDAFRQQLRAPGPHDGTDRPAAVAEHLGHVPAEEAGGAGQRRLPAAHNASDRSDVSSLARSVDSVPCWTATGTISSSRRAYDAR